jgi:hypothetical protein
MKFLKPEAQFFLKKTLGDEGFEQLNKFELYKQSTNTTIDPQEIAIALQIVPRTMLSFLQKELGDMAEGQNKTVELPVKNTPKMDVTKFANDVYSGEIYKDGKISTRFKYRSLPGVGLVIMTAFELYEKEDVKKIQTEDQSPKISEIQKIIDERIGLQLMVRQVVDQKLSERDAMEALINKRLTEMMSIKEEAPAPKKIKLKDFLEKRISKKLDKSEHLVKSDSLNKIQCPDCGQNLFANNKFSGCICLGEDKDNKVFIKKTEDGIRIKFSKSFDPDNIEILLDILKKKNRG